MFDETQQSDAALKAKYADQAQGQAVCGNLGGYSVAPLMEQLRHRINRESDNIANLHRAADILARHPEFEEFVWLIRSGLI